MQDEEAALVRLIFDLADFGRGDCPMDERAIAGWLNENGHRNRGRIVDRGQIAAILARPHYTGRYPNMTTDEDGTKLPEDEWVCLSPSTICKSVRQTPHAQIAMRTSPGPGTGSGFSTMCNGWFGPPNCMAASSVA